jgi:hypothetical protein
MYGRPKIRCVDISPTRRTKRPAGNPGGLGHGPRDLACLVPPKSRLPTLNGRSRELVRQVGPPPAYRCLNAKQPHAVAGVMEHEGGGGAHRRRPSISRDGVERAMSGAQPGAQPSSRDGEALMEGWLKKRGTRISSLWSDRYFALRGDNLYYYLKQGDPVGARAALAPLSASPDRGGQRCHASWGSIGIFCTSTLPHKLLPLPAAVLIGPAGPRVNLLRARLYDKALSIHCHPPCPSS